MDVVTAWYVALPHFAQLAIWGVAMVLAAGCCSRKARTIHQSGR